MFLFRGDVVLGLLWLTIAHLVFFFQFVKKNVIENIIPIIIALKHRLEELKSPLIGDLMNCLRELMKDYKNEVKDMLAADKQLAAEIEFDLKKWAAQEEEAARKEAEVNELWFHVNISRLIGLKILKTTTRLPRMTQLARMKQKVVWHGSTCDETVRLSMLLTVYCKML